MTDDTLTFGASSAGYCIRAMVAAKREGPAVPHSDAAEEPFLDMGHRFQDSVIDFLRGHGVRIAGVEAEGILVRDDYEVAGHVDGVLERSELLEVKAVTSDWFQKIVQADHWGEIYPQYKRQAWMYQGMKELVTAILRTQNPQPTHD